MLEDSYCIIKNNTDDTNTKVRKARNNLPKRTCNKEDELKDHDYSKRRKKQRLHSKNPESLHRSEPCQKMLRSVVPTHSNTRDFIQHSSRTFQSSSPTLPKSELSSTPKPGSKNENVRQLGTLLSRPKVKTTQQLIDALRAKKWCLPTCEQSNAVESTTCQVLKSQIPTYEQSNSIESTTCQVLKSRNISVSENESRSYEMPSSDDSLIITNSEIKSSLDATGPIIPVITSSDKDLFVPVTDLLYTNLDQQHPASPIIGPENVNGDEDAKYENSDNTNTHQSHSVISSEENNQDGSQQREFIDGNYDTCGKWHSWTESYDIQYAVDGVLKIWPYVELD